MRKLFFAVLALLVLNACQEKQYFDASPEIDLVKKANDAYFKGDWSTMRSVFADTARIWFNTWHTKNDGLTPDQFVETLKTGLENYSEYKMGDEPIYEMIVTDEGDKWVHCWFLWSATTKSGVEVNTPVSIGGMVKDGKIVYEAAVVNALPGYLAAQPIDSTSVSR